MDDSIELKLVGITYNQIESGVYALILEDPIERRRLAIVIGYPEAQSIECHLQKVRTPRPLAHDLLASLLSTLDARLRRVDIHRLPTGPYAGQLTIENQYGERKVIDARSSDAIALAIRVGAPIYTNRALLDAKGYVVQNDTKKDLQKTVEFRGNSSAEKLSKYSDSQLEEMIVKMVNQENYEKAAEIKKELERRKSDKSEKEA